MERRHLEPEILKNRDDLENIHSELLKRYDYYFIRSLDYLKNKNNLRIFYLNSEKMYCVVTGKDLKKVIKKKMNKDKRFLYADK